MTILPGYHHFDGRHYETGSIHNMLAYQGVTAPHTGKPYSEAFLLGMSGGITFGYFTFDYQGYDPILALLTRNTFDPLQTMLERLGIRQNVLQTNKAETGQKNLEEALANGRPALVWADVLSLPFSGLPPDEHNWEMQPVLVYGLEDGFAHLAFRSACPWKVPAAELAAARARVKKDKFRLMTIDPPDESKLPAAARQAIHQCIQLYTEKPPKGAVDNFGFAAYQKWANLLTNTRNPQGWDRFFPPGPRLLAALAGNAYLPGAYGWIVSAGTRPDADRSTYADFLDEAAALLEKPRLQEPAGLFRESGKLWQALAPALLPEDAPLLGEARRLKDQLRHLMLDQGGSAVDEIQALAHRWHELHLQSESSFPYTGEALTAFRQRLRQMVEQIHDKELAAIQALKGAMAG